MVGRAADVGCALLAQEEQQLLDQAGDTREVAAVVPQDRRPGRVVRPEQFVRRVDQVQTHGQRYGSVPKQYPRVQPAALIAPIARSPSPGFRLTAAIASWSTSVPKPSWIASRAVELTQ